MNRRRVLLGLAATALPLRHASAQQRPAHWAQPVALPGAPNLHKVADGLYRSAQPEAAGFRALAATYGVRSVVSLRQTVSDTEFAKGTGLTLNRVPIKTWHVSDDRSKKVVQALRLVRAGMARGPVLVHCTHGADRTGMIIALWRMIYGGWTREAAVDEMLNGAFGFHAVWGNIPDYLKKVDIADLKRRVEA